MNFVAPLKYLNLVINGSTFALNTKKDTNNNKAASYINIFIDIHAFNE